MTVNTINLQRKDKNLDIPNIDALVAGLEDEDDDIPVAVA